MLFSRFTGRCFSSKPFVSRLQEVLSSSAVFPSSACFLEHNRKKEALHTLSIFERHLIMADKEDGRSKLDTFEEGMTNELIAGLIHVNKREATLEYDTIKSCSRLPLVMVTSEREV